MAVRTFDRRAGKSSCHFGRTNAPRETHARSGSPFGAALANEPDALNWLLLSIQIYLLVGQSIRYSKVVNPLKFDQKIAIIIPRCARYFWLRTKFVRPAQAAGSAIFAQPSCAYKHARRGKNSVHATQKYLRTSEPYKAR